ncbi:MAG TPA: MFS transporter [Rhizomicrobium sp.]|nr:MFS transporter [Rhizomicrobium sp.]
MTPAQTRLSLVAILSACVAYGIGMGLTLPLLSLILERMGVPGSINGFNLATGGLAALLVTPYVPRWMARTGAAEFLALSLVVSAAALLALYEIPNLWLWFPVRFVVSSALNALFVVTEFWINRLASENNRGRYIAVYVVCIAGSFGIGPAILQFIGTRGIAPFAAGSAMLLVALVPVMLARRTAPRIEDSATTSIFSVVRAAPTAFAAAFVFGAIDAGMVGLLPVYAVRSGYTEAHAALCVTAMAVGSIVFQYPLGALADHFSRRALLALCAATGALGSALTPFAVHSPMLLYLLLFLWGGLIPGVYSIGLTMLGQRYKGGDLANANAGFVILYSFGLLLGPAGEGVALDAWNPHGLLAVLGAICAAYVGFLLFRPAGSNPA